MQYGAKSIRPFIGAKNFEVSRQFYKELRFEEHIVSKDMSYFTTNGLGFYLQDYYLKTWVNNSMIFLEVDNVEQHWKALQRLELTNKYKNVRLTPIKKYDWGREYFMHDPSGVLWHIGEFSSLKRIENIPLP